ncbi:MAG TPA: serine/threonine-protein kinase, partial [Pyrinomonadaceae bacterium]
MKVIPETTTIAHYRIMESLGAGGMGAVFKAYDEKLHRVVALKLLPPEYTSHEDRRRRFLQEARAASALNHPHILTVYEFGEDAGRPYMATEYVEGETLRQKIAARALQVGDTLELAIQIA